jgi:hypothetical protein
VYLVYPPALVSAKTRAGVYVKDQFKTLPAGLFFQIQLTVILLFRNVPKKRHNIGHDAFFIKQAGYFFEKK